MANLSLKFSPFGPQVSPFEPLVSPFEPVFSLFESQVSPLEPLISLKLVRSLELAHITFKLACLSFKLTHLSLNFAGTGRSKKTKAVEWEFPFNCFCFFGPPGMSLNLAQFSPKSVL